MSGGGGGPWTVRSHVQEVEDWERGPFVVRSTTLWIMVTGADPGFGQGGAPASEAESCRRSEAEWRE